MSETTQQPEATSDIAQNASDLLINFLIPMFLACSGNNVALARKAAEATVNGYRIRGFADLIAVIQVVAFSLASIGSLSLSMTDDIPLLMIVRLQSTANALNRSEHRQRRILAEPPPEQRPTPPRPKPQPQPVPAATHASAPAPKTQPAPDQPVPDRPMPGGNTGEPPRTAPLVASPALTRAAETQAREAFAALDALMRGSADQIPGMKFAEPRSPGIRAAALGSSATHLLTGAPLGIAIRRDGG